MNNQIFISLASYIDPLLFFTMNEAMRHAAQPALLRFAVVDQHVYSQRLAVAALAYAAQVRYVHIYPQDSLGVSWARNLAFSLYDGESYFLQIDSHTCFEPGWDDTLRQQHTQLLQRSSKPIVSTYPYRFDFVDGAPRYTPSEGKTALILRPHPETSLAPDNVVLRFIGKHLFSDQAVPGCHVAGGFIFCAGQFVEEVPYDPYLYFHGEEQSLAVRAYTRGWDIFHPTYTPLYHLYKEANTPHEAHHWHGEVNSKRAFTGAYLTERAKKRLMQLMCGSGMRGAYGLGTVRSMAQFAAFSGIDYAKRSVTEPIAGLV